MNRANRWQSGSLSLATIPERWRDQAQMSRAIALAVMLTAAVAGAAIAMSPIVVVVVCVAAVAMVAITSVSARFAVVVTGGLFVFGTSDQVDAPKAAYFAWVVLSGVLAIASVGNSRKDRPSGDDRSLLVVSMALSVAIVLSLLVALSAETPIIDSMRDAAPYCLLVVAPLLAWDAARSRLGPHMEAAMVASGLIASVGFAVEFIGRRGIADLPSANFGSGSVMLAVLVFVVAVAALLSRRPRRLRWLLVAAVVIALLFATGTRSSLALLVGPAAMLVAGAGRLTRLARLAGATVIIGALVLSFLLIAGQSSIIDLARLADRLGLLLSLGSNLSADQSFIQRAAQVGAAGSAFAGSPVMGVGLGFRFDWVHAGGASSPAFTLDTGLSIAAKFGLVGLGLFGIAASAALSFYRRLRPSLPDHVRLSFVGFAAVSIAMLPLGNPLEDKGFGLAVAMLVAWALASAKVAQAHPNPATEMRSLTSGRPIIPRGFHS